MISAGGIGDSRRRHGSRKVVGARGPGIAGRIGGVAAVEIPGVGAQGGNLQEVCQFGITKDCGLIVNASRSIIYASNSEDFAEAARAEALKLLPPTKITIGNDNIKSPIINGIIKIIKISNVF